MDEIQYAGGRGERLAFCARGEGPPLLLIMGLAARQTDWPAEFIEPLAAWFRVVTYDHRGCGASDPPAGPVTMASMARDAAAVLDAAGAPTAHVAGLSMGGMIAQRLAIDHAARVDRLALIATHAGGPNVVAPAPDILAALFAPLHGREEWIARFETIAAPGLMRWRGPAMEAAIAARLAHPTPHHVMQAQFEALKADDRHDALGAIAAPTLVITGDADPLVPPANSRVLAGLIPGARLIEIPRCGHLAHLEWPGPLADCLLDFFGATPAA